ncbi:hypothetical protein GQ53DRAFT_751320 [Thozetella sp. PMI_491]|nr:hypothetical protein GQ53DRAFT_751320 [Thozetella sp. PMI_491]
MRTSAIVLACLLHAASTAAWSHATEAGFRKAIRSNEHTLVACDASEALEPEWVRIQETERDNNILSVDCAARSQICKEFGVVSYPSIRLYREGGASVDRYRGPRRAKAIVGFLRRALRSLSFVDHKNITSFLSVDDVVFIGHISPADASLRQRFEGVAAKYRDRYSFAISNEAGTESALACYNNVDDVQKSAVDLAAVEALEIFVRACAQPAIPELTRRNEIELMSAGKSMVHYFVYKEEEREQYVAEMRPLAKKYEEYLQFDTIDATEYAEMVQMMGFAPGAKKALSVQNPRNGDVFPYRGGQGLSAAVVEEFLMDIINGQVQPWTGQQEPDERKHEEL